MDLLGPVFLSLLFSALFSGIEIAFISSNKLKIELDKKQGSLTAKTLSGFVKKPSWFIGAMLVGNNISLVIYGIFMGRLLEPLITSLFPMGEIGILIIQTIISTLIILVTAEFLPKSIFRINPNQSLKLFAIPLLPIYYILYLPTLLTVGISELILRVFFGIRRDVNQINFGRVDLHHYVSEFSGDTRENTMDHELQILQNALDFSKVKVRDCMVPRTEITAIEIDEPLEKLRNLFIETGYSKILVFRDNIDNIIGYVHSNALFKNPTAVKTIMLPVLIVPETMDGTDMLEQFISRKSGVAVVVDEFGGTAGMLTIEDVIEEIFGEIEDEHDTEELIEQQLSEEEFIFSARLEIDYLNDKYNLKLPESEEYETLAGLILNFHEDIPQKEELILMDNFQFRIIEVSDSKIELVNLILADD